MISISGLFAVTFSVVFAYVADVTDESNRTTAYGLVFIILNLKRFTVFNHEIYFCFIILI